MELLKAEKQLVIHLLHINCPQCRVMTSLERRHTEKWGSARLEKVDTELQRDTSFSEQFKTP